MSVWTHVLGIIRYDSIAKNMYPEPANKARILNHEMSCVRIGARYHKLPSGSEGPVEVNVIATDRGPTVVITGDLRGFGKSDIPQIIDWLNNTVKSTLRELHYEKLFVIFRDAHVACTVEGSGTYTIQYEYDKEEFYLVNPLPQCCVKNA